MEGQSNGPKMIPDITGDTCITDISRVNNQRNYPGTEGRVYDSRYFGTAVDVKSIPASLRIVSGAVQDGIFSEVVLAPERRREIVGRVASGAIQNIPRSQLGIGNATKVIDGSPAVVQQAYKACRNRIIEDLKKTGTAIVPMERLSQVVIRVLNLDIQKNSGGRNNISYKAETTNNGTPVYVIQCDVREEVLNKLILSTGEAVESNRADDAEISSAGTGAVIPPNEGITQRIEEARQRFSNSLGIKRRERPTES